MHLFFLLVCLISKNVFIFCSQPKRVIDQMYISFDNARFCVRRLNGTHEIGCQSSMQGNAGRMYMIDNNEEFNSYIKDNKIIDSSSSFIIVLNLKLFQTNYIDRLMNRLDKKLNGLLLYLKSYSSLPTDFSHDDQCPNHRSTFYLNQTKLVNWNQKGTGLFFRSFPFPILLIDEEDDYARLLKFYQQFNNDQSTSIFGLELKAFQNAAHTTKTCMRRNDILRSFIDEQVIFCDPIEGLNIYSKLPQSIITNTEQRSLKSVILILTSTDSFQMFTKATGSTGGSQQPATALITFLSLAHLIGQEQNELKKQNKEIIFVTIDGDAMDYSGSFKFMYDIKNEYFPMDSKSEQLIKVEHIHSIIEFQTLTMADQLWLHTYPSSLTNDTFINLTISNNPKIRLIPPGSPLLPASSQIFLRETSSSSFPAYILSTTNQNQILNTYYHSFLDNPSTLSINISTLEYNTTTNVSQWIKSIVEPFARTLIESLTGKKKSIQIKQEIINNLVYCVLKNMNCPLIHNVTNSSVGNTFQRFNQVSLPFTINTYPKSSTLIFSFIENILSYFLRDRSFDFQQLTQASCKNLSLQDSFFSYTFVDGYLPSIMNTDLTLGYCVRSYIRSATSISPAFVIENYDLSQTKYPTWSESRWSPASVRLFLIPTRTHEMVTFVIGILLTCISFIVFFFLRYYTKISLLQPSSS